MTRISDGTAFLTPDSSPIFQARQVALDTDPVGVADSNEPTPRREMDWARASLTRAETARAEDRLRAHLLASSPATSEAPRAEGAEVEPEAQPPAQSAEVQATEDAQTLRMQFDEDPAAASAALLQRMEANSDPTYRAALLEGLQGTLADTLGLIQEAGPRLSGEAAEDVYTNIARAAELEGGEASSQLAEATAQVLSAHGTASPNLNAAIATSVVDGAGTLFSSQLSASLIAADPVRNYPMAADISYATTRGVESVRRQFQEAREGIEAVEQRWQAFSRELVGRLPQEDMERIRADFEATHADTYEAYEDVSMRLGSTLSGLGHVADSAEAPFSPVAGRHDQLLRDQARIVAGMLPELEHTEAGRAALADQVVRQGQGEPNLLMTFVDQTVAAHGNANTAAILIANVSAHGALRAAAAGNDGRAQFLLDGLRRSHRAFGISEQRMGEVTDALNDVRLADTPEARRAAAESLRRRMDFGGQDVGVGGPRVSGALGALGGALALGRSLRDLGDGQVSIDDLGADLRNVVDALGGGIDTTVGLANIVGRNSSFLTRAAGFNTRILGPIGGVLDGAFALGYAADGEYTRAALSGLSAAGAIAMAVPGGQLIGAGLLVGGFVGGFVYDAVEGRRERRQIEGDLQHALQIAGFSSESAALLAGLDEDRSDFARVFDHLDGNGHALAQMREMSRDDLFGTLFRDLSQGTFQSGRDGPRMVRVLS